MFAAPFGYLLVRTATGAAELAPVLLSARALVPLGRTLLLGVAAAGSATALGTALAWLVARTDLPGRRLAAALLPLPLVFPSFIGAFALIAAFAPGGLLAAPLARLGVERLPMTSGFWGSLYVLTLFTYPYVYMPVVARLRQLPASLEESARLLGRRPAAVFRTVVLPQASGAVLAGALLVFLYAIGEFGVVQLMRYQTLTVVIYATRVFERETSLALSLLLGVLAVAVAAAERRLAGAGPAGRLAHGTRTLTVPLGRWKAAAVALVGGTLALALAAPAGVLAFWAVRGLLRGSTRASALVADPGDLAVPALNTATMGVLAAVVAVAVTIPVAYLTTRYRSLSGSAANAVIVGGFALPGLVIALALVFWTLSPASPLAPLYQTQALLVGAYVMHFGSQALRAAQATVAAIPPRLEDAARTLGARRWRRLRTVELPLALPGLAAGAGLVLLSTMKELPATLVLAPPGFETLATRIWLATEDAFLADASVGALLLVATSGVLTWLLVVRRDGRPDPAAPRAGVAQAATARSDPGARAPAP